MAFLHVKNVGVTALLLICFFNLIQLSHSSKYSKEANSYDDIEDESEYSDVDFLQQDLPFKMKKVNMLWIYGRKRFAGGPDKLAALYKELKIQDKHEAYLKKLRADGLEKDGDMENKVLNSYKRIMEDFDLESVFEGDAYMENELPLENEKKEISFQDPKLQSMWRRAQNGGYSDEDLQLLEKEFREQEMRIFEFDYIHRDLKNVVDLDTDNSMEWEQKKLELSATELKERKDIMKKDMRQVREGYMRLEHLASNLPSSKPTFEDGRVQKLWDMAQQTNWTKEELVNFKEELRDVEHRLSKQAYYEEQIDLEKDKENEIDGEQQQDLKRKYEQISMKVSKALKQMKTRLTAALKHSEL